MGHTAWAPVILMYSQVVNFPVEDLRRERTLTRVAQLDARRPAKQSDTSQHTWVGYRFSPQSGRVLEATDRCYSLTLVFLFLSFSLPPPLSKNK